MTSIDELKRMLEGRDRHDASFPDLPAIMGRGRRLRRRRRAGVAAVAAACCLAIAVPVGVRMGTDDGRGSDAPVAPTPDRESQRPDPKQGPSLPRLPFNCLDPWWRCAEGVVPARPLGTVIETGVRMSGVPILLFAERADEYRHEPVLATLGFRDPGNGQLMHYSTTWPWPKEPPEMELLMVTNGMDGDGPWTLLGAVTDPDATAVTAVEPDGSPLEVGLSEREVAPGMRVFWMSGDSYSDPDLPATEIRVLDADGDTLTSCVLGASCAPLVD